MLLAYKTEINPTAEQKKKINQTIGVMRWISNQYIAHNSEVYKNGGSFVSAYTYQKWVNNTFLPTNPAYFWVKEASSKSVKKALMDTEVAFKKFFKGKSKYPKFKKKSKQDVKMYFVKNDSNHIISCERHRIKIPTLGWVRLKEKAYIPSHSDFSIIKSGTVSMKAGRYYVSVLVEKPDVYQQKEATSKGIGIDLGISNLAICSNGNVYGNINKTKNVKRLERKLKREQRKLSRKYEAEKLRIKNKIEEKGEPTRRNIQKQVLSVQKIHQKLAHIRNDYQNKVVMELVKTKPAYITIEDLNVSGMMKNRHLSKAISQQSLYKFREKLTLKTKEYGVELRIVSRFFPSSKTCNDCGSVKKDLKLSDRTYRCNECGYVCDRDMNASFNLRDVKHYKILT